MQTKEQLRSYFDLVDEDKKQFAYDTIDEYIFFSEKIEELKKYPLIEISKRNPAMQRQTAAGKMLKDYSQILDSKRATLLRILYRVENSAADDLISKLKEFE